MAVGVPPCRGRVQGFVAVIAAAVVLVAVSTWGPPQHPVESASQRIVASPRIVALADGVVATGVGSARVEVPAASEGITALHVTFDCLTAGVFAWRIGSAPARALGCSGSDAAEAGSARIDEVPFDQHTRVLSVEAASGTGWSLAVRFVGDRPGGLQRGW